MARRVRAPKKATKKKTNNRYGRAGPKCGPLSDAPPHSSLPVQVATQLRRWRWVDARMFQTPNINSKHTCAESLPPHPRAGRASCTDAAARPRRPGVARRGRGPRGQVSRGGAGRRSSLGKQSGMVPRASQPHPQSALTPQAQREGGSGLRGARRELVVQGGWCTGRTGCCRGAPASARAAAPRSPPAGLLAAHPGSGPSPPLPAPQAHQGEIGGQKGEAGDGAGDAAGGGAEWDRIYNYARRGARAGQHQPGRWPRCVGSVRAAAACLAPAEQGGREEGREGGEDCRRGHGGTHCKRAVMEQEGLGMDKGRGETRSTPCTGGEGTQPMGCVSCIARHTCSAPRCLCCSPLALQLPCPDRLPHLPTHLWRQAWRCWTPSQPSLTRSPGNNSLTGPSLRSVGCEGHAT